MLIMRLSMSEERDLFSKVKETNSMEIAVLNRSQGADPETRKRRNKEKRNH